MERSRILLAALALALATAFAGCKSSSDAPSSQPLAGEAQKRARMGKQSGTALQNPGSCSALEAELKSLAAAEIGTWFEMYDSQPPPLAGGDDGAAGGSDPLQPQDGERDYTNNQVAGVHEADIAKTDGNRLFVLGADALHRFDIPEPGGLIPGGEIDIEGQPAALLFAGERLLVLSLVTQGAADNGGTAASGMPFLLPQLTKATVIEWPGGGTPVVLAERYFDGYYLTARGIGDAAYAVLHGSLPNPVLDNLWRYVNEHEDKDAAKAAALNDLAALSLDALLPRSYLRNAAGEFDVQAYTEDDCGKLRVPADSNGRGLTSIVSLRLDGDAAFEAEHIVANHPVVHVSAQHLFLAEAAQDWWWFWWNESVASRLNVHAFSLNDGGSRYLASGRVEGAPVNQFAMDEHEGVLRVATWTGTGAWWRASGPIESRLHTLRIGTDALEPLGELGGIAPGEQLFAARFVGDTGYLVTFEIVDPLFVVDLSDPASPAILGELKIPGFSTYLHPHEDGRLLAVGVGGNDSGLTWNTVVSLFDVSDSAAPALLATHDLARDNSGWNWSESLYDHKAFQYQPQARLLAIPLGASRSQNGIWEWNSTLELISVGETSLSHHGSIDHSAYFSSSDADYRQSPDIRRSFFIGDYVYAISGKAVTAHPVDNPAVIAADALIDTSH